MRSAWFLLCIASVSLLGPLAVHAQPTPKGKATKQTGPALDELAVQLASQDGDELRLGIESAATSRRAGTAALLAARVREGLPVELLGPAIDALAALGDPKGGEVLGELAQHRRPAVRARAILALSMLHPPEAENLLIKALSDQNEDVRNAAVDGLSQVGGKLALPPLFRALERDVEGAAVALGKLAEPSTVPRVTAYFGRISFTSLAPILDAVLTRRNLSEELKLSLVEAIVKQGSTEARAYLESISGKLPADAPLRLRKSITDALLRMPK
jgi:HEAT repeat protein